MKTFTEEMTKQWVTIADAAKFLGVSQDTLRRWEKKGTLIARRTAGGHRRYSRKQLERSLKQPMTQTMYQNIGNNNKEYHIRPIEVPPTTTITPQQYPYQSKHNETYQRITNIFKNNILSVTIITIIMLLMIASYILLQISKDLTQPPLSPIPGYKTIQSR